MYAKWCNKTHKMFGIWCCTMIERSDYALVFFWTAGQSPTWKEIIDLCSRSRSHDTLTSSARFTLSQQSWKNGRCPSICVDTTETWIVSCALVILWSSVTNILHSSILRRSNPAQCMSCTAVPCTAEILCRSVLYHEVLCRSESCTKFVCACRIRDCWWRRRRWFSMKTAVLKSCAARILSPSSDFWKKPCQAG